MGEFAEILAPSRKGFHIVDQSKYITALTEILILVLVREGLQLIEKVPSGNVGKSIIVYFQHNYDDINFGISVSDFRKISEHLMKVVGK